MTNVAGINFNNCGTQTVTSFTTVASTVENGSCGTSNGGASALPPTTNLCSVGTATNLSNSNGSFTWSCTGNNGGTTASCNSTVTPAASCVAQNTLPAIAGWWRGDDNVIDSSTNANNGTAENGASYALGLVNDAISLNGSNQYVLIGQPVPASLQLQNHVTLQAWIYPTAYPNDLGMILGSQYDGSYGGTTIFFDSRVNPDGFTGIPTGHIHFQIGDGSNWHSTDSSTQVPLNQWTLVTATRDAGGAPHIYYNGVDQPLQTMNNTWSGVISYPSSTWFAIGQQSNINRPFTGLIDEAMIFNQSLTAAQIQSIYNAGNAGVCHN
jgi:hypothetical protein